MSSLRHATRRLWRDRSSVAMILLTLTCSTALVVAAYALFDALLLRPWPVPDAENVVVSRRGVSAAEFRFIHERVVSVDLGAVAQACPPVRDAEGRLVSCEIVSGNYFDVLRLPLRLGRGFLPHEDVAGQPVRVAIIGFGIWRERFQFAEDAIGRVVMLNGKAFTVVGVAPERTIRRFSGLPPQYWLPLAAYGDLTDHGGGDFLFDTTVCCVDLVGRSSAGAAHVADELTTLHQAFRPERGTDDVIEMHDTRPIGGAWSSTGPVITALIALSSLVVLIASCANVSTIQVARGLARHSEFQTMRALGASRATLARPLLLESLCIVMVVSMAVAMVVTVGVFALESLLTTTFHEVGFDLAPNWRVALVCLGVTMMVVCATGVLPVMRGAEARVQPTPGRGVFRWIIGTQIACSTATLLTAALLWQGLERVAADVGESATGVARVLVSADTDTGARVGAAQVNAAVLEAMSSFDNAGVAGVGAPRLVFGAAITNGPFLDVVEIVPITTGYFSLLRVPLLEGRLFDANETSLSAVVNESFARRAWPRGDAVGGIFEADGHKQVVGVVRDVPSFSAARRTRPTVYIRGSREDTLLIRDDASTRVQVAQVAAAINPSLRVVFEPLSASVERGLQPARVLTTFAAALAVVALVIASSGVFAVVSLASRMRRREIAVRLALGVTFPGLLRLLLRTVAIALTAGVTVGIVLGALATPLLRALIVTVTATDEMAFLYTALVIVISTTLVTLFPAVRAFRVSLGEELRAA